MAGVSAQAARAQAAERVIIDTDPGTDDALAILLALRSPELRVEALTVVAGNVTAPVGLQNALKIVSLAERCDLPVAEGAQRPLHAKLNTEPFWNGPNGLGGAELPPASCKADPRFGPDVIIELVHKYPHEVTIIGVGPETNLALALLKDPTIVPLVKRVILMAGLNFRRQREWRSRIQRVLRSGCRRPRISRRLAGDDGGAGRDGDYADQQCASLRDRTQRRR